MEREIDVNVVSSSQSTVTPLTMFSTSFSCVCLCVRGVQSTGGGRAFGARSGDEEEKVRQQRQVCPAVKETTHALGLVSACSVQDRAFTLA